METSNTKTGAVSARLEGGAEMDGLVLGPSCFGSNYLLWLAGFKNYILDFYRIFPMNNSNSDPRPMYMGLQTLTELKIKQGG